MSTEETPRPNKDFDFTGKWLPALHPLRIGGKNYTSLSNYEITRNGLAAGMGYSAIAANMGDYVLRAQTAIHLRTPDKRRSILLAQVSEQTASGTPATSILQQIADTDNDDIPAPKTFESARLHYDADGAGQGRFAYWPRNHIAYCNSKETLIYAGPEMPPAKIIFSDSFASDPLVNPIDQTEALTNSLNSPGNAVRFFSYIDTDTSLLLTYDGADGQTTLTDKSCLGHTVTRIGDAVLSRAYKKFGSASGYFPGAGGWSIPAHAAFSFAEGDFTIDQQTMLRETGKSQPIMEAYKDVDNYWLWEYIYDDEAYILKYRMRFIAVAGGTTVAEYLYYLTEDQALLLANSFVHLELCRTGGSIRFFVAGKRITAAAEVVETAIGTSSMPTINAGALRIGTTNAGAFAKTAYYDNTRITTGLARHLTNFTPPTAPYAFGHACLSIYTLRPIQGVKIYVSDPNTATAQINGHQWTGTKYETLRTLSDQTYGLSSADGSVRFASTVGSAQPRFVGGNLYYAYRFQLSAGSAEIYRITVDAPPQPPVDLWDGVLRPVQRFKYYKGTKWHDATIPVQEETPSGAEGHAVFVADVGLMTAAEHIEFDTTEQICAVKITMYKRETADKVNILASQMKLYCWMGTDWDEVTGLQDGTSVAGKTLNQTGFVSFNPSPPGYEVKKDDDGQPFFRYRIKFSAQLYAYVWIDKVEVVPAPQNMFPAYKFPFMFQGRPMLCARMGTAELNRVDYGMAYATEGWNGEQSSNGDGRGPLYIGDGAELTCAAEIYNRLGSSIFTFALFFKKTQIHILHGYDFETYKIYPLDTKIGCPAPGTLDTSTIPESPQQQSARTVACFLSFSGPYIFDAGGIQAIPGIECYFDERDPRCINFAAIDKAIGWFSPCGKKYNLQIPSGASQTENNVWLVYDFEVQSWYPKTPTATASPYFSAVARVSDAHGQHYIYGFRHNAKVMRLDHGTTYDGQPIAQHVETGEILPTDSIWVITKEQLLKIIGLTTPEPGVILTVTLYRDNATIGQTMAEIPVSDTTEKLFIWTGRINPGDGNTLRVRMSTSTSASPKGVQLLAWGIKYSTERTSNR